MRAPEEIDAEQFIGQKSFKAKGKRISTWQIGKIEELEPVRFPEPDTSEAEEDAAEAEENLAPDAGKSRQQVIDEMTRQLNLFSDTNETTSE